MASKEFSNTLKNLRIKAGFTQKQVYEHFNIPQSTFSSWEVGKSEPSGDMLIKLCDFYKCDMMKEFSNSDNVIFTANELELIEKYIALDDIGRSHVDSILNWETERVKILDNNTAQLTELRHQLAAKRSQTRLRLYTYLGKIACAGTGFYFDDIPTDTLEAPFLNGADFIIGISGDSMEPNYHDGEKLYVQKVKELTLGDVGIFTIHNECFVKELGDRGLISRNPEYEDIEGTEDVRLIGRVLGKVEEI